jgi:hypothetical protein
MMTETGIVFDNKSSFVAPETPSVESGSEAATEG